MLVEFETVKTNYEETWNREQSERISGEGSEGFYREQDYIGKVAIEMDTIIDFEEGLVWHNDIARECVFAINDSNEYSRNLLITYEQFKKVFEKSKGIKVYKVEELLS